MKIIETPPGIATATVDTFSGRVLVIEVEKIYLVNGRPVRIWGKCKDGHSYKFKYDEEPFTITMMGGWIMKYLLFKPESGEDFVIRKDCVESIQKITKRTQEQMILRTTSGNEFTITEGKAGFDDIIKTLEE